MGVLSDNLKTRLLSALRTPEAVADMEDTLLEVPLSIDVTISSAEMLALFTTEKTLVPAPGTGKCIIVDSVYSTIDYNSAAYVIAASDTMNIKYSGGSTVAQLTEAYLESTADARQAQQALTTAVTPLANTAVTAKMSTTNPTTGDSEVKIRVYYRIVDSLL
jgi:hypothetical protein